MPDSLKKTSVSLSERQGLLKNFPCFSHLSGQESEELAMLFQEVEYGPNEKIVVENEYVDSIYIIVSGEAEVSHEVKHRKKFVSVPIAVLNPKEAIGLNDTGFYSTTGKRMATVKALTKMILLRLDLKDLYAFLKKNDLESNMYSASLQMLRMQFIKQSLPFAKISHDRLHWLAESVEEIFAPKNTIIFSQGEEGDKCYLVKSGLVEIVIHDEQGKPRQVALLKPPVLFGEITLITHEPRNATAIALEDSQLLMLRKAQLSELMESEENVANMFMTLMVDRSRPIKNPHATIHHRVTADGHEVIILKNPENNNYFKLSQEGAYIWKYLDGKHTLQDITMSLTEQFNVFAPDMVAALISKLTKAGFISNLEITESEFQSKSFLKSIIVKIRTMMHQRFAFGDANTWITQTYNKYVRFLFSRPAQWLFITIALLGFYSFVINTAPILDFFSVKHASLLLIIAIIPLSIIAVLLHELAHAYAVKSFGREVHYIGIGWNWFTPIAFTDTSDMWLATRKPRMLVNLAGIYMDMIIAGIAALFIAIFANPYIEGLLWLFALYTYISAFRRLSPLHETDGYYVLMDWVEKTNLREAAVLWLIKKFPKAIRKPSLFRKNWPEVSYWLIILIFLILVSLLTLVLQEFVFIVLEITQVNIYIVLILPFLAVIFSSLGIIYDIKNKAEE